jgi:HD superfamily phosphohydrolase YqeK
MMSIEFQLLMLAGLLILLAALALGLARRKTSDPKRAFLLAVLHDLPASGEEANTRECAFEKTDSVTTESAPGPGISDFFA